MNQFKRAQVIMLSTENQSRLFKCADNILQSQPGLQYSFEPIKAQHLYIISDDEIKEGDWIMHADKNIFLHNLPCGNNLHWWIKIIATTDTSLNLPQPSQQFIEKYIQAYNKGEIITDVLVEYEADLSTITKVDYGLQHWDYKLKINSKDNTITIKKLKDNWSREELEVIFKLAEASIDGCGCLEAERVLNIIRENL